ISLDQLMGTQTNTIMFEGHSLDSKTFKFTTYLAGIMQTLAYVKSHEQNEFYYYCKDSPVFYNFGFREFSAFKYYFWMSTLMFIPAFKNKKVNFDEYPDEVYQLGRKILSLYNQIDSVEIWNMESLNYHLRQIDYYRD